MPTTHIFRAKTGRTTVHIPSFVRDMFNFESGEEIEIITDGKKIILIPKMKEEKGH
jgi:AbrB family looped-hinge helix DNA binding protein